MKIGAYELSNQLILAPMAGITDRPFRMICKEFGASLTVSEMIAANPVLRDHKSTRLKADHDGEQGLCSVQLVGTDPKIMADAARYNVGQGAKIIDINMGCPAKKVCAVAAGSALLKDPGLVKRILDAVVNAVDIPVTLKIRTGWDANTRNAIEIAKIAENAGIAALTVHGRTRACKFEGQAEYGTIKQVKSTVNIPVIANGDINSPEKARFVLQETGADAIMIGRSAQGNPWLFEQINSFVNLGKTVEKPSISAVIDLLSKHVEQLYGFYGDVMGVKIARKHIGWYFNNIDLESAELRRQINQAVSPTEQMTLIRSAYLH